MKTGSRNRMDILKRVALFHDLSEQELNFLVEHSSSRHFEASELIFTEGDPCSGLSVHVPDIAALRAACETTE